MMMKSVGDADSETKAEQSLRQAKRPEIVISPEESARNDAPKQCGCREHEIGQMRRSEQCARQRYRGGFAGDKAQQAVHEIVLQKKLLVDGPKHVAGDVGEVRFVKWMEGADLRRGENAERGEPGRRRQNPERADEVAGTKAKLIPIVTVRQHYQQGQQESNRRENALQTLRHPDDSDNHAVAEDQLNQVTGPAGREAWHEKQYGTQSEKGARGGMNCLRFNFRRGFQ